MKEFLWLIRRMAVSIFRNYSMLIVYFVLPIIGVVMSLLIFSSSNGSGLRIGIVEQDHGPITRDIVQYVSSLNKVTASEMTEQEARERIVSGELDAALIFADGFSQSVRAGNPDHVQIVSIKGAQVTAYVKSFVANAINQVATLGEAAGNDDGRFEELYSSMQQSGFKLTTELVADHKTSNSRTLQSIGYLSLLMLVSACNLTGMMLKDRENRTYYRMLTSPVSVRSYVAANIIMNFVVLALQVVVMIVVMKQIFHIDPGMSNWQLFAMLLMFALVAVSLSLALIAFARNSMMASAMYNIVIMPTCMIAGCFFPEAIMPNVLRRIAEFLPQHWLLDTTRRLQQGEAFASLGLNMAIMAAFVLVFTMIAVYKLSRSNDVRNFV